MASFRYENWLLLKWLTTVLSYMYMHKSMPVRGREADDNNMLPRVVWMCLVVLQVRPSHLYADNRILDRGVNTGKCGGHYS